MDVNLNIPALDKPCAPGSSCETERRSVATCNMTNRHNDNVSNVIKPDRVAFKKRGWKDFKVPYNRHENLGVKLVKEKYMVDVKEITEDACSWKCCQCLPMSSAQLMNQDILNAHSLNVLTLPLLNNTYPWTRLACDIKFVWSQHLTGHYVNFTKDILSHSRIAKAIQDQINADKKQKSINSDITNHYKSKACNILHQMSAEPSIFLLRLTGWFLFKMFKLLLNSLVVHRGQMYAVQRTCKKDHPVVFLPIHRSHLDYILLSFVLFNFNTRPPYVAAGENLILPFFGKLMRKLGGFFIRRRMEESKDKRDFIYRAVLHTYVEELLRRGESLEFFIEGGRSRSGKILMPKTGLLSVIVDAYLGGVVNDVSIVPVSISYEKLPEVNFVDEQLGIKKKPETFWKTVVAVYRTFFSFYGSVRIDFSQPFSLKEFIAVHQLKSGNDRLEMSRSSSDSFITSSADEGNTRALVQTLANHVAHDQTRIHSISSTQLVAWALLYVLREGSSMEDLVQTFEHLREEVTLRNHGLGFTGSSDDVVRYALRLLGNSLVKVTKDGSCKEFVAPVVKLPQVIELSYYANTVNMVFCLDSIVANSLYSVCGLKNKNWHKPGMVVIFNVDDVVEDAVKLLQLMRHEFIFIPPCETPESAIDLTIDLFLKLKLLCNPEDLDNMVGAPRGKMLSYLEEPHDIQRTLALNLESIQSLLNLKNGLGPILETCHVASTHLNKLLSQDMKESEFVDTIHHHLKQRAESGTAEYDESACLETLKNCIRGLQESQILRMYDSCDMKRIGLIGDFHSSAVLEHFVAHLATYRN